MHDFENDYEPNYTNIYVSFVEILGNLSMLTMFKGNKNIQKRYIEVYNSILKWAVDYEMDKDLSIISDDELADIYNKVCELNNEILWTNQGHLSDAVRNWLSHLKVLRERQIEKKGDEACAR